MDLTLDSANDRSQDGKRRPWHWLIASVAILVLTAWLMRNWIAPYVLPADGSSRPVPTSSRREVLTEMTIVWMFQDEIGQGNILTEWNPYWFSGFPWLRFLSYPLYYVVAILGSWTGLALDSILVAFYFVVMAGSGLAMYAYLQEVTIDWRAALVGAIIYEAFPYHNHVGVETWIHAAFWVLLPVAFWAIERSLGAPRGGSASIRRGTISVSGLLLIGLVLSLFPVISSEYTILAGPFVAVYLAAYLIRHTVRGRGPEEKPLIGVGKALLGCGLVGFVVLGLSAFFVLPGILEVERVGIHAKHAAGSTFTDGLLRDYSVTPGLVWYAIAQRLNLPARLDGLPSLVHSFWSIAWYPGVFSTALVLLGLSAVRRSLAAALSAAGLLISILLVVGPASRFGIFSSLPVVGRLSPFRGMLLVATFMSILAAFGLEWLLKWCSVLLAKRRGSGAAGRSPAGTRRVTSAVSWVVVVAVAALILYDFWPSAGAYQTMEAYASEGEREAYDWIAEQGETGRLWDAAGLPRDQYLRTLSLVELTKPRFLGYYDNGAPVHTWQQTAWTDLRTVLYLHQVRHVILRNQDIITPDLSPKLSSAGYVIAFQNEASQVWENPDNTQYTRFYCQSALDVANDFFLSFAVLPDLVWRGIALVAGDAPAEEESGAVAWATTAMAPVPYDYLLVGGASDQARDGRGESTPSDVSRVIAETDVESLPCVSTQDTWIWSERVRWDEIVVEAEVPTRGVLTVAESWYPHWRVQLDGEPAQALRVNWALLGVHLEPGMHHIRFTVQRPWYVSLGFAMSLLTLGAMLLWWARHIGQMLNPPRISIEDPYPEASGPEGASG